MKKWMVITSADTNDGDYHTNTFIVNDDEKKEIESVVQRIMSLDTTDECGYHTPPHKMYKFENKEEMEELMDFVLDTFGGSEYGFHTIEEIEFVEITGVREKLNIDVRWDVTY